MTGTEPNGVRVRIDHLEDRQDKADTYRHELRGDLAGVKMELAVLHNEVGGLRQDQEEQQKETQDRLQSISRWFMFAGTSFLALAGLLVGVLAKGG